MDAQSSVEVPVYVFYQSMGSFDGTFLFHRVMAGSILMEWGDSKLVVTSTLIESR